MPRARATRTLALDIGGSGIKAMLLDAGGRPASPRRRSATPRPAFPEAVLAEVARLAVELGEFDRVSVGFPGVIENGVVRNATNLGAAWNGVNLEVELRRRLDRPVRVANDADVHGMGAIEGRGVELVVTLGTGVGTALFVDGRLVPNLEIGQHPLRKRRSYEDLLGERARRRTGRRTWNRRLRRALETLSATFNYRRLYLGGGNARHIDGELPAGVVRVRNLAGLLGGIRLWADGARPEPARLTPASAPRRPAADAGTAPVFRTSDSGSGRSGRRRRLAGRAG
jgi:polyphosphate glucokinase